MRYRAGQLRKLKLKRWWLYR